MRKTVLLLPLALMGLVLFMVWGWAGEPLQEPGVPSAWEDPESPDRAEQRRAGPELVTGIVVQGDPLAVDVGATVTGILHPLSLSSPGRADGDRPPHGLSLSRRAGSERFPRRAGERIPIQSDGSFRFENVPPGSWDVYLEYFRVSIAGAKIRSAPPRRHKLASFTDLEFGEMRQVVLDASALLPGKLTGQIFLDGQPYANAKFGLRRSEIDGTGRLIGRGGRGGYKTDENGRFSADVEGGYVSVFLTPGQNAGRTGVPIEGTDQLHVSPSRTTTGVFNLVRMTIRVRFLEHDGTPATQRYISRAGGRRFENLRTDANGWLVLDPAPTEPVTFHTWPKEMDDRGAMQQFFQERKTLRVTLGPVQIPPGTNQAEFTLRLPADRQ